MDTRKRRAMRMKNDERMTDVLWLIPILTCNPVCVWTFKCTEFTMGRWQRSEPHEMVSHICEILWYFARSHWPFWITVSDLWLNLYCPPKSGQSHFVFNALPIDGYPDNKVHGANMGPIWGRGDPCWPHVVSMNLAIRLSIVMFLAICGHSANQEVVYVRDWH